MSDSKGFKNVTLLSSSPVMLARLKHSDQDRD